MSPGNPFGDSELTVESQKFKATQPASTIMSDNVQDTISFLRAEVAHLQDIVHLVQYRYFCKGH